ncbi:hypothetical protein AWB71_00668 [Caballeronia peredens]|nr:hypothetical protein AWB71_00668 [Caballeronia peredens]
MHITSLTLLAFYLNGAVDSGKRVSLDDMYAEIEAGTVFDFLKRNIERIDLSSLNAKDKSELIEEWQRTANAVDARRKLVVEHNGYCLLLAYVLNGIQHRYGE